MARIAIVRIKDFLFFISINWNYIINVETPESWIQPWQINTLGEDYSVKHRSIQFLQAFGLAPNYFAGFKWFNLTDQQIALRERAGRQLPKRKRSLMFDPDEKIKVTELKGRKGRRFWDVDFKGFKDSVSVGKLMTKSQFDTIIEQSKLRGYDVLTELQLLKEIIKE
jgi:hypothetical protein